MPICVEKFPEKILSPDADADDVQNLTTFSKYSHLWQHVDEDPLSSFT